LNKKTAFIAIGMRTAEKIAEHVTGNTILVSEAPTQEKMIERLAYYLEHINEFK
jgi:hypothetical protein